MVRSDQPGGLSHCFIVLDPGVCSDDFTVRLQSLINTFRGLEPADPSSPVLIPGDPERQREKTVKEKRGVRYSGAQFRRFVQFSALFDTDPPNCREME